MKKNLVILLLFCVKFSFTQDIHFSQNFVDRLAPVYAKRKSEMPDKYSFRDRNAIYSTETHVSESEIPKERETYTQTKRKTIKYFLTPCFNNNIFK